MKIRNGFVSNSSSSSFMIGVGVIFDMKKFKTWKSKMKKYLPYSSWDLTINNNPLELNSDYIFYRNDKLIVVGQSNSNPEVSIKKEYIEDKPIAILHLGNNEGDDAFQVPSFDEYGYGEISYNINLDFFSKGQQKVFEGFGPENGIEHVDKMYGAGRDG